HDARKLLATLVDTKTRTAHALDALDDRTAGVILQTDVELRLTAVLAHRIRVDIALILKNLRNRDLQFRARHRDRDLLSLLSITDARQHVGDRIGHTHFIPSLPARLGHAGHFAAE